jgi:hypothetical protein
LILGSDRPACIAKIRETGYDDYAGFMADKRLQSIKRN